jgi:diacylglycerol O-acyltransferase / wax synthase
MRQLTSLDALFLALEDTRTFGHVSGLAIYDCHAAPDGVLTSRAVKELIGDRLHLLPPLRWRLAEVPFGIDYPYWFDEPEVDLDYHVTELVLPAPGDDAQLAEQVARLVARPLDRSRPLWEMYLVHGLAGKRVAVVTKLHHAAMDGVSTAEFASILFDLGPGAQDLPASPPRRPRYEPSRLSMLGLGVIGLSSRPAVALRSLPAVLPHLDAVPTVRALPGVRTVARVSRWLARRTPTTTAPGVAATRLRAPRTRLNGRLSRHRRVAFCSLSLERVKAVKNVFGVTVNDVVIALSASALRSYLIAHEDLPATALIALVPVSVRTAEEAGTFGNRVSSMLVPLPTDEPDPVRRLLRVHEVMRSAKEHHRTMPTTLLQDVNLAIPPALMGGVARAAARLAAEGHLQPPANVVISNIPGSPAPLYFCGARLISQFPLSMLVDGVGLNITVLSYGDKLDVGLIGDREQMADVGRLVRDLHEALDALGDASPSPRAAAAFPRDPP